MRRLVLVFVVMAVMVAMVASMAVPAFAAITDMNCTANEALFYRDINTFATQPHPSGMNYVGYESSTNCDRG
jgi:hypothetical protein